MFFNGKSQIVKNPLLIIWGGEWEGGEVEKEKEPCQGEYLEEDRKNNFRTHWIEVFKSFLGSRKLQGKSCELTAEDNIIVLNSVNIAVKLIRHLLSTAFRFAKAVARHMMYQ